MEVLKPLPLPCMSSYDPVATPLCPPLSPSFPCCLCFLTTLRQAASFTIRLYCQGFLPTHRVQVTKEL